MVAMPSNFLSPIKSFTMKVYQTPTLHHLDIEAERGFGASCDFHGVNIGIGSWDIEEHEYDTY